MEANSNTKCSSCVYYPSNCSYLKNIGYTSNAKVVSSVNLFMTIGCKYYIDAAR